MIQCVICEDWFHSRVRDEMLPELFIQPDKHLLTLFNVLPSSSALNST